MGGLAALLGILAFAVPSAAHVALDSPKSGLTLTVGSTVSVTWEDTILHDGVGYDLDLVGSDAMIQSSIVSGLPTSVHSYDWVVPDIWCVGCYLMVTQLNRVDHDYSDSALINIYGKQVAAGGGGSGGSPSAGGGGSGAGSAAGNGSAGNLALAGSGGTLDAGSMSGVDAGSGSSAAGLEEPDSMSSVAGAGGRSGGGIGKPGTSASAGASSLSGGGSSSSSAGAPDTPDESAGAASLEPGDSGGCAINPRRARARFAQLLALLSFGYLARKRCARDRK